MRLDRLTETGPLFRSSPDQDHFPMRNSGFLKDWTGASKGHRFIKTDDGNLSMKVNRPRVLFFRGYDGSLQNPCSDASPAIAFQHRHASYLGVSVTHDNPCRRNCFSRDGGQKMDRTFVVAIQLNLFWDTLLFYENAHANGINRLQFLRRRNLPHSYGGCHNYPLEIKELILYPALTLFLPACNRKRQINHIALRTVVPLTSLRDKSNEPSS